MGQRKGEGEKLNRQTVGACVIHKTTMSVDHGNIYLSQDHDTFLVPMSQYSPLDPRLLASELLAIMPGIPILYVDEHLAVSYRYKFLLLHARGGKTSSYEVLLLRRDIYIEIYFVY